MSDVFLVLILSSVIRGVKTSNSVKSRAHLHAVAYMLHFLDRRQPILVLGMQLLMVLFLVLACDAAVSGVGVATEMVICVQIQNDGVIEFAATLLRPRPAVDK